MAKGRSERRQRTPVTNTRNYCYTKLRAKTHATPLHLLDFDPQLLQGCLIMVKKYGGLQTCSSSPESKKTPRNRKRSLFSTLSADPSQSGPKG